MNVCPLISVFESTVANLVTMGPYGTGIFNPKSCGLSLQSYVYGMSSETDCMEWHKDQGTYNMSAVKAPWLAVIYATITDNLTGWAYSSSVLNLKHRQGG